MLSCLVMSIDMTLKPHRLWPTSLPCPWDIPRQEYWRRLPFPSSRDLPKPGIEPKSPAMTGRFFTTSATWERLLPLGKGVWKRLGGVKGLTWKDTAQSGSRFMWSETPQMEGVPCFQAGVGRGRGNSPLSGHAKEPVLGQWVTGAPESRQSPGGSTLPWAFCGLWNNRWGWGQGATHLPSTPPKGFSLPSFSPRPGRVLRLTSLPTQWAAQALEEGLWGWTAAPRSLPAPQRPKDTCPPPAHQPIGMIP